MQFISQSIPNAMRGAREKKHRQRQQRRLYLWKKSINGEPTRKRNKKHYNSNCGKNGAFGKKAARFNLKFFKTLCCQSVFMRSGTLSAGLNVRFEAN